MKSKIYDFLLKLTGWIKPRLALNGVKQKVKHFSKTSVVILIIVSLLVPWAATEPSSAEAFILPSFSVSSPTSGNFGGMILKKQLKFCLIKVPPPIFILPIPFYYIEVGPPSPALLYYMFFISNMYLEYAMEKTSNSLGNYYPAVSEAFRQTCMNKSALPIAMGVINKIGTSCRTDPRYITDECHKRVLKREAAEFLHYKIMLVEAQAQIKILTMFYLLSFTIGGALGAIFPGPHGTGSGGPSSPGYPGDSSDPADDYSSFCDPYSPSGSCYTVGACDATASTAAGCCIFTAATQQECIAATGANCATSCSLGSGIPSGLIAPATTPSSVTLSWDAVPGASGYNVYRNGSYLGNSPTPNYTDSSVIPESAYVYEVTSMVAGFESGRSATVAVTTAADSTPPTAPGNLTGSASGTSVSLSWIASSDDIGVAQYWIYRDGSSIAASGPTSFTDTNAPSGQHDYYVIALDATGNQSATSNTVTVIVP